MRVTCVRVSAPSLSSPRSRGTRAAHARIAAR
jgi:hypothetical protein